MSHVGTLCLEIGLSLLDHGSLYMMSDSINVDRASDVALLVDDLCDWVVGTGRYFAQTAVRALYGKDQESFGLGVVV